MQTDSTVDDVLKEIDRFRILCVGRSGVGKSSVINRVFGLPEAAVEHWKVGKANVEKELTSNENRFFVLHDSMGFEAGDTDTFDMVSRFVNWRRDKSLPLKGQLHAVWLCTETPTAGGRVFETGDEKLLQLAYQTETPVVVVFTKYDRLLRSKKIELKGDQDGPDSDDLIQRAEEEAQKVMDTCVRSLDSAMSRLHTQKLRYAKVSVRQGYEALIPTLVEITRDLVQEKLKGAADTWVMWAIAQRASLPLKIDACIKTGTVHYERSLDGDMPVVGRVSLRHCLAELHQNIITCWNFRDDANILISERFKQLMKYLVQDVQESQSRGDSYYKRSPAIDKIFQSLSLITTTSSTNASPLGTTNVFADWLKDAVLHNAPQVRLLLMTYVVDLTAVLKSLFDITLNQEPQSSGETTWSELKKAFEEYDAGSRQRIHHRICAVFQQDQQILDPSSFHRMFHELVKVKGVPPLAPTAVATSSTARSYRPKTAPLTTAVATSSTPRPTKSRSAHTRTLSPAARGTPGATPLVTPLASSSNLAPGPTSVPTLEQPRRRRIRIPCLCGLCE